MYIEREDVLQQIALLRLTSPSKPSSNYEYQRALDSLGRRKLGHTSEVSYSDLSSIADEDDTRLQQLTTLSYRLYRIKDIRLRRIVHMYFFMSLNIVEIGVLEQLTPGRICQLLHSAMEMVE